ncbi:putative malate dehydrogenase 1B [Anthonomus grandis grandis]|uniref:putative malate dehydrogenase 1B n=1 Tax=Anthonomus grandis grandis TaxID=2921223 RepID=UPI002166B5AD|nr:putative malate dehydrogenase 1B [Anthonomus grandis grandis]
MAFFTICGKPDCKLYAHATYVAHYLYEHLPNFKYKKIEKSSLEWPAFVKGINEKNKWYLVKSPIIWKEISSWGGKPYLIGGLSEFWEYCFCYYGLESFIPKEDLEKLAINNLAFFQEEKDKNSKKNRKYNAVIGILGVKDHSIPVEQLIEEFLKIPFFTTGHGILVKIYFSESTILNPHFKSYLSDIAHFYNSSAIFGDVPLVEIVETKNEIVEDSDLLLIMTNLSRRENENSEAWMERCACRIVKLGNILHYKAKRGLRVVFCNDGPLCYLASILVETCAILIPSNIVVLAADLGLPVLREVSRKTGIHVSKMGAPPVWGFIGNNYYIDESHITFKAQIFKPYKRALTSPEDSSLPLGTMASELRLMSYLLPDQHDDIMKAVDERQKRMKEALQRPPCLSKLRALISLLKIWYSDETPDEIISLGIVSNGSFNIPCGLVFAQPCILDGKRRWKPFSNFPLVNDAVLEKIDGLIEKSVELIGKIFSSQKEDVKDIENSADETEKVKEEKLDDILF